MVYRDYMQKFRPVFAPDAPGGGAAAPAAVEAVAAPAPAAPVAAEAAPAAVEATAPAAVEAPASEPTLLEAASATKPEAGSEVAKTDTKESPAPAEAAKADGEKPDATKDAKADGKTKPDGEAPKEEAAKADPDKKDATANEPPAPIKYDVFKLPEGVKLDDQQLAKFTEVAGKAQIPQDIAQNLMDIYIDERKQDMARADQHQRKVWNDLNDTWKAEFRKDPQLGGNREQTTLATAKAVLEEYGGSAEQVKDLLAHTKSNGMGNYLGFIRLLNNIGEALNVFETSDANPNPAPPKSPRSRGEKWYGNNGASQA